ncbi:A/G-specific adenine glycosylase [Catellatospora bangladeshensis]|uniref:Adenine DNA glycosylase n=1 Tax=Catellatospora bangladeshensis TaxID=310355 RepID=A0A8J3NJF3_9ACTN|nr:A/G-specific adenine glycosylase [Catellatospora bangladeshensis]GIF81401.1 adenine glycosylase [Catellatospora bangladeshensis]
MSELASLTTAWYDTHARDLPWRAPDVGAWPVLVSEFMLQQTPVVRVLPVWREWVARWPAPADLAVEESGEAIRAWGRLGYPRRAMRLHACATALVERHGGEVPRRLDQMLALPGVGDYTARAVLAFAYGQRHPVVDTNVRRVAARTVTGAPDAGAATTPADLALVESLLPAADAAAARASAAFMELGAVLCTARTPRCESCPLRAHCKWRASGAALPEGPSRKPQRYAGTDRQVRGLLLAVLRHAPGPVARPALDVVWADAVQRERALASLLADGLVVPHGERYALPGTPSSSQPV